MLEKRKKSCTEPEVGRLLKEAVTGELAKPGREDDLQAFREHIGHCQACRQEMVDYATEHVTIPRLRQIAEERGVTFEEIAAEFVRQARARKRQGKPKKGH